MARDTSRLDALLSAAGLAVVGGTHLFRLVESDAAADVYEKLGRAGIYTRRFPDTPRWLRFGLPGEDSHWGRLEKALTS